MFSSSGGIKYVKKLYAYKFLPLIRCASTWLKNEASSLESPSDLSSRLSSNDLSKLEFREVQTIRRKQALQSLFILTNSVENAPAVHQECQKCGQVQAMFHYRLADKEYFLIEMNNAESVKKLLKVSGHPARDSIVPVRTRLLDATGLRITKGMPKVDVISEKFVAPINFEAELTKISTVSEQLQSVYSWRQLSELGTRMRYLIGAQIEDAVSGLFPDCRIALFGSSVNSFGHNSSDVDMILDFDAHFTDKLPSQSPFKFVVKPGAGSERVQTQRSLELLADQLQYLLPGYSQVQRILMARVPIVKFLHDASLVRCDLSITNPSGLVMSRYLHALSQLQPSLPVLMTTIRMWASANRLTNMHPGCWITNFQLLTLLIFFYQATGRSPSLAQLKQQGSFNAPQEPPENLGKILAEFFSFYATFKYKNQALSLIEGKTFQKPDFHSLYIENPVESGLNISKNLTAKELDRIVNAMRDAAWALEGATNKISNGGIIRLLREFQASGNRRIKVEGYFDTKSETESSVDKKYLPDDYTVQSLSSPDKQKPNQFIKQKQNANGALIEGFRKEQKKPARFGGR